ncbi:MAG: hypothetical protein ABF767_12785 [Lentilactobacillus hilgardii]
MAAAIASQIERLWVRVGEVSDYKEIEELINKWFDKEIDKAWQNFLEYRKENRSQQALYDLENANECYKENLE